MSRVFLAEETRLGRQVVVKVLPPEMGAAVNVERFEREIQLAARLQHPHVVPLLTAGSQGDLLWYIMPYIAGESLRAKLAREGELPIGEAVRILREIVDALAYAHRNGVVHRDIKPDNVLLSEGHAVVTDFGVAKAVSASSGKSSLTSLGVALGTPAYMAPEQAAADPHVDHRADIYAAGTLAYEMLAGRLPFTVSTPQAMLAAQITQAPDPLIAHRPTVSPELNGLVMRCLEKRPADRWQNAGELLPQLDAMTTPGSGSAPAVSSGTRRAIRISQPGRVAILFAAAALVVLAAVYFLVLKLGLPYWVLGGAVLLLLAGLPIMLATARHERQRAVARTAGMSVMTPAQGIQRWLTWRKALIGGGLAFGALALVAGGYTAMRLMGIGPVGTLMASGTLKEREPLLLADFDNRSSDSTLGTSLTEAFRVDLSQSSKVRLADQQTVRDALQRMERPNASGLPLPLAREIAEREGIRAVVSGQIDPVGKGYVLSASLITPADGQVLTAVRENAGSDAELLSAIDRLSRKLRERIGESLVTIREDRPLEQVTTSSLAALRKYTEGVRLFDDDKPEDAVPVLKEAVALDTGFAMAWRKLAVIYSNTDAPYGLTADAATRAFRHRDRLPELERNLTEGFYHYAVDWNPAKVETAYRAVLAIDSTNPVALNNLALQLNMQRRWPEAENLATRAFTLHHMSNGADNAAQAQVAQGHLADAERTVAALSKMSPSSATAAFMRNALAWTRGDYAAYDSGARALLASAPPGSGLALAVTRTMISAAITRGRIAEARRTTQEWIDRAAADREWSRALQLTTGLAGIEAVYGSKDSAARILSTALQKYPLDSIDPVSRPYGSLAGTFAMAGRPDMSRRLLAQDAAAVPAALRSGDFSLDMASGLAALAEGHYQDDIASFRKLNDETGCGPCGMYFIGNAYDKMNQPDSARMYYQRAVEAPTMYRYDVDATVLASSLKRLGELYEAKGDKANAVKYYGKFVDLWKNADPQLQPTVRDVKTRLAQLTSETGN